MSGVSETYKEISPAEFFYKYREIAGFSNPVRAVYQTVRELVENALDATDAYGILPNIKISILKADEVHDFYKITVEDNGIGIPPNIVPSAFGKVLFSSKYVMRQTRGMYGLGVKMVVLYAQMTTGRPVEVTTSRKGLKRIYHFKIRIDVAKNEPIVVEAGSWKKSREWHGTIVSVTIEGDWNRAKQRVLDYIQRTSIALPYADIVLTTPEGEIYYYQRVISDLPKPPVETKPHPLGIDLELLSNILKMHSTVIEALLNGLQSMGEVTATRILKEAGIDPSARPDSLSQDDLLRLLDKIRSYDNYRPPSPKALSPLGEEVIKAGLKKAFKPEFVEAVTRKPSSYSGHPFIVEVGIAYGGGTPLSEDKPIVLRYANKIPLLYDEGSDVITQVVREEVNWENYLVTFPAPLVLMVHVCSTKVPFKGVGKESIADVPELHKEIKAGVMEVARALKLYLAKKAKEEEALKKAEAIAKYIPEVARSLAVIISSSDHEREGLRAEILNKLLYTVSKKTGVQLDVIKKIADSVEAET